MTTKAEFIANISKRLGRSSIEPPKDRVVGAPIFWQQYHLSSSERLKKFVDEVNELGAHATAYTTFDDLQAAVRQLLSELNPPNIVAWRGETAEQWQFDRLLAGHSILEWRRETFLQDVLHAKVSVTAVDYAIAETGSLVVCTDKTKPRVASLVSDVHIALVRSSQLYTRMGEVLEQIANNGDIPSSLHFITGPSRSSDIENDLSIGVHGPAALYVFVLAEQ
jgi:L-lactate dehydrogenase complex protein LldG